MPAKRSTETDTEEELRAWRMVFHGGFDFLGALPRIGIPISDAHQPDVDQARDAWGRLGDAFLDRYGDPEDPRGECWAQRTFGAPAVAQRPTRRPGGRARR